MSSPNTLTWGISGIFLLGLSCQPTTSPSGPGEGTGTDSAVTVSDTAYTEHPFDPLDEVIGLDEQWTGDLEGMIERRRIRVLVPYSQTIYYIDGPNRRGIAYEAMVHFEEELNRLLGGKLKGHHMRMVFIPVTRDKLLGALLEGYGDIIPANLMVTEQRQKIVDFSVPTMSGAREVVVSGPGAPPMKGFEDLYGKTVCIRLSSSFNEHIRLLNDSLKLAGKAPIKIQPVEDHFEDEEILEMVNAGLLPMTVVDEQLANFWAQILDSIQVHPELPIHSGGELAWAMRKNSPQLKKAADDFILKNRKGTQLGNILFNRYLKDVNYVTNALTKEELERFHACRDYFIQYGEKYQLDWLMLAAQAYQESRLDQKLRSPAGAIGVMQIKPATAGDPNVGIPNVQKLENNIHAGAKYLRFLIDRYFVSSTIDSLNAGLLAMAAYNAGPAKIQQLREKAKEAGLNPDLWFDNVELIAAREIGRETVQYVSNIYKYYSSYRSLYRYMIETGKTPYKEW